MIKADSVNKLNTSVIYIVHGPSDPALLYGIDPSVLVDVVDAPDVRLLPSGAALTSMRSQLTVDLDFGTNRLEFSDRSAEIPNRADFPVRVALATEYIGKQISQNYDAIVLNFEIEWDADDNVRPSVAMLGRIVKRDALKSSGYDVAGASAQLWYLAHDKTCDLRIEPRGNQFDARTFYANLNIHMNLGTDFPSADWLSQALKREYEDFTRVLANILTSEMG